MVGELDLRATSDSLSHFGLGFLLSMRGCKDVGVVFGVIVVVVVVVGF